MRRLLNRVLSERQFVHGRPEQRPKPLPTNWSQTQEQVRQQEKAIRQSRRTPRADLGMWI